MPILTMQNRKFDTFLGETLLSALQRAGADIGAPCGGNHSCGKCFIEVSGNVSAPTAQEIEILAGRPLRLACFTKIEGDCTVTLHGTAAQKVVTDFVVEKSEGTRLFGDEEHGIAIDIGTTTIAAYLYDSNENTPVRIGEYNHQQRFGADVMARIAYANENGVQGLQSTVEKQIDEMIFTLCKKAKIEPATITTAVITGNTTMLHLFRGLSPRSLGLYPFTPESLFDEWHTQLNMHVYLPPCISAFIGADIVCGMAACDLENRKGNVLFADIGTNGEMALKTEDGITVCSTAAGPAFEGAGISCGTPAVRGAICKVHDDFSFDTIDGASPIGLCGSGLIDAISAAFKLGYINDKGLICKELDGKIPFQGTDFALTQQDIREFQLAKGAIRGGMDTLLHEANLTYNDIDEVILCGGFGSFIDVHSAQTLGLLPPDCARKTVALGNLAGQGAAMALVGALKIDTLSRLAQNTDYIELSTSDFFKKRYVRCMYFKEVAY